MRREKWIFNSRGVILILIVHCMDGTLIIVTVVFRSHISHLELAIGPYQKNTPSAVRLEPAIYRLQFRAFHPYTYINTV